MELNVIRCKRKNIYNVHIILEKQDIKKISNYNNTQSIAYNILLFFGKLNIIISAPEM